MRRTLDKVQLVAELAREAGVTRKQVAAILDALERLVREHLGQEGDGQFVLPGLLRITRKNVPARPAKRDVPNPFKPGERMDVPARPAAAKLTIRPLRNLRDLL